MKSARESTKLRRRTIPYSTSSAFVVAPGAYAEALQRRQATPSPLGRLARSVRSTLDYLRGKRGPRELHAGDVLRDLPYYTSSSEVAYFSTHPSYCDNVFGFHHGERVHFHGGVWAGRGAVVIGARAGALWVALEDDHVARALSAPADMEADETMSAALERHYGIERRAALADPEVPSALSPELLTEVAREADRMYSGEQQAFLQRAPDLFASVVDDAEGFTAESDGDDDKEGRDASIRQGSGSEEQSVRYDSLYEAIVCTPAQERTVVLLSPRVVVGSGTVGWGGEGTVMVAGGGVRHFAASLSASVVL